MRKSADLPRNKSTASVLKLLAHFVEINGDITYSQHGCAVLRDEGESGWPCSIRTAKKRLQPVCYWPAKSSASI